MFLCRHNDSKSGLINPIYELAIYNVNLFERPFEKAAAAEHNSAHSSGLRLDEVEILNPFYQISHTLSN